MSGKLYKFLIESYLPESIESYLFFIILFSSILFVFY